MSIINKLINGIWWGCQMKEATENKKIKKRMLDDAFFRFLKREMNKKLEAIDETISIREGMVIRENIPEYLFNKKKEVENTIEWIENKLKEKLM